MKNKLLRFLCIMMLICSFGLSGCIGTGGGGSDSGNLTPPGDDLTGTAGNAENIMNTKDNVTYYYKTKAELAADAGKDAHDRNSLKHSFGDAYVFVDPGADYEIVDHYSTSVYGETSYPFYKLVGRQVELLADILTNSISRVYLDGSFYYHTEDAWITKTHDKYNTLPVYSFGKGEEDSQYNAKDIGKTEALEFLVYDESPADETSYIDLTNIYTYIAFADLTSPSAYWNIPVQIDADTTINQFILNLNYAVLGGIKVHKGEFGEEDNKQYYVKYYQQSEVEAGVAAGDPLSTYLNSDSNDNCWAVAGDGISDFSQLGALRDKIKNGLMSSISSALSGIEAESTDAGDLADNYEQMLRTIDHLGFTATDKLNIITQILNNVVGETTVNKDKSYLKMLQDEELVDANLKIQTSKLSDVLYNSNTNFSIASEVYEGINYKGYEVVIEAMVEQAVMAMIDAGFGEETAFPGLPRIQIIKMDSWNLMDPVEEEPEEEEPEEGEEVEEVNPDDIITDVETIEFKEKFGNFQKIVAILFEPMQVYGERTMAIKENGEWVKDDDGNVKLKTFTVEGFILTGSDLVMLSEEDKMANYKIDYQIHTATKDIKVTSEISEVGYVRPDPSEEATYNSTTTLDIDKQEIIEKEESEIEEYRIQGYDGYSIVVEDVGGLVVNQKVNAMLINQEEEQQSLTGLKMTLKEDGTYLIDISTEMYKYIGIYDVNGDAGTTFAGYLIDASGLAGNNYLITNFSILSVNDDDQNRDCALNILYYFMDCT